MYLLHPATVHFPIALLLAGSALELWAGTRERADLLGAARLMLRFGWWAALAATLTGFATLAFSWQSAQAVLGWINAHAATSLIIVDVYWRVALARTTPQARRRLLIAGSALIILTGWLGGHLAHGFQ
ncbi:MAG TPA: DUF2231 domain-containing protein [Herpetosiphonaceae bacterium]|nr:DUF2231 domain-containing protein [Herpetosiphonaceae bacterium]